MEEKKRRSIILEKVIFRFVVRVSVIIPDIGNCE
jgi:hypothetical protein